MRSRYCYCPMAGKKLGRRITIADRFRKWKIEREALRNYPDVYMVTGYNAPVYPKK